MITETQARQQNLSGFDVFKQTHLCYKDDLNRDAFVVRLNFEAYKIFLSSILIGQYPTLKEEQQKRKAEFESGFINSVISPIEFYRMEYVNLENFYIATGFELHFKSTLLQNNFVVNIFDNKGVFKSLCDKQKDSPVHKDELFNISGYFYDPSKQINILNGITENSLNFGKLCTSPNYASALNLSSDILGIAEDFRNLRNQIHLPGDAKDAPFLNSVGDRLIPTLVEYINENIVENTNQLIAKHKLNYSNLLQRLNYFD